MSRLAASTSTTPGLTLPPQPQRSGVTLTEVLMSLMIMSIGISSVMVLFPISVLRSVQSTQLTNAAILKYNTEARIRQNLSLVFDPDGDYQLAGNSVAGQTTAVMEHFRGNNSRNYIVDPVGYHNLLAQDNTGDQNIDGNDDIIARAFGNDGAGPGFLDGQNRVIIPRFDGGILAQFTGSDPSQVNSANLTADQLASMQLLAAKIGRLNDGRINQLDTFAAQLVFDNNNTAIGVIPVDAVTAEELIAVPTAATTRPGGLIPDPELCEITLFSLDNQFSQTYPLTYIDTANRKIFWSEYDDAGNSVDFNANGNLDVRPLPLEFYDNNGNPQVGRIILRTVRPADFSWLLTVRRASDGQARGVDVVVRYHSDTKLTDERLFQASFVAGSGVIGLNAIGDPQPVLKRGGFIFDARNARWYRITSHEERPLVVPSAEANFWKFYTHRLLVESPVISDAGSFPTSSIDAVYSGAMFLPGVVDVYPMGSLSLPDSL
jgi:prepilin-type N-terminal cleavage/methylation domain-containing protein